MDNLGMSALPLRFLTPLLCDAGEVEQEGEFQGCFPVAPEAAGLPAMTGIHVGMKKQPVIIRF
jgi:hypothetical protein